MEPQYNIFLLLSLLTLIQRLAISLQLCAVKELLYTGLNSLSSSPRPVLPKQPVTHLWPWLQLWVTSHHVSVIPHDPSLLVAVSKMERKVGAGSPCSSVWLPFGQESSRTLCWFLATLPCLVIISIVAYWFLPSCSLKNSVFWCYWAEGSIFWGMTVKKPWNKHRNIDIEMFQFRIRIKRINRP